MFWAKTFFYIKLEARKNNISKKYMQPTNSFVNGKVIRHDDLTNILIVVVRYFGGKKLGISGLINAYKTSSNELIKKCKIKSKEIIDIYEIEFEESNKHNLLNTLKKYNFKYENLNQGACNIYVKRSYTKSLENLNIFLTNKKYLSSEWL